jgi:GntR family histidine utilization transcriptional repressor
MKRTRSVPGYQRVKAYILRHIHAQEWRGGDQIPSELALTRKLHLSRMTVNRALRELTHDGFLVRTAGSGTFVADHRPAAELLQLRNIAEEIRGTGRHHSAQIILLRKERAKAEVAAALGISPGEPVFHSIILHLADGSPVQVEDRHVNPLAAPDYLTQDFRVITPNEHLMHVAPVSDVEHIVEASMPDPAICLLLDIAPGQPCLLLRRRTWSGGRVASAARLIYPGNRHRFGTKFSYLPDGLTSRSHVG